MFAAKCQILVVGMESIFCIFEKPSIVISNTVISKMAILRKMPNKKKINLEIYNIGIMSAFTEMCCTWLNQKITLLRIEYII